MKRDLLLTFVLLVFVIFTSCSTTKNNENNNAFRGVQLNSTPAGASIYLDGTNLFLVTPALIDEELLIIGDHHIRLYLDTFNEINIFFNFEEGDGLTFEEDFAAPQPPLPVFEITTPVDLQTFNDNVIAFEGTITLEDRSPFLGDYAILNLNGMDWLINVYEGEFNETISIASGANLLWMRANSQNGDTGISDVITVYGDFVAPNIEVVLFWNTPTSDMDLHIWNPLGEHCYYNNMIISDGSLDIDDTEGFGPETFTSLTALDGTYTVMINSYSLDSDTYADASVQLFFDGGLYDTYGPHHFATADYNGEDPESWWEVVAIEITDGRISRNTQPVSDEIRAKIVQDMKNLSRK
jgi:hypothetical protein